jgi:hypothetical protein
MGTADLREKWTPLLPEIDQVAKSAKTLRTIAHRLATEKGYEALLKVQKDLEAMDALAISPDKAIEDAREALVPVREWLSEEWTRRAADFAEDLSTCFKDREVTLTGHAPDMSAGPLVIRLDISHDKAALLYGGEIVRDRLPLVPEQIFRHWTQARDALDKKSSLPEGMIKELRVAYEDVLKLSGHPFGRRARLSDVHFQMFVRRQSAQLRQDPRKNRVKDYPRYQFTYDLGRLIRGDALKTSDGKEVVIHPALKTAAASRSASIALEDGRGGFTPYSDLQFTEPVEK